eukprot:UN12260
MFLEKVTGVRGGNLEHFFCVFCKVLSIIFIIETKAQQGEAQFKTFWKKSFGRSREGSILFRRDKFRAAT